MKAQILGGLIESPNYHRKLTKKELEKGVFVCQMLVSREKKLELLKTKGRYTQEEYIEILKETKMKRG